MLVLRSLHVLLTGPRWLPRPCSRKRRFRRDRPDSHPRDARRGQAHLYGRPTSPVSRRRPPTTCWHRCRASPSVAPTAASAASARRRRTCSSTASESPTSPAARSTSCSEDPGRQRRADRDRRRGEPRHRRACPGQVANVILKARPRASGQFEWNPSFRAHFAKPELLGGSISYSGKTGPVDYTLSVKNNPGRGGLGGPIQIYDANGVLTETPQRNLPFRISSRSNMQLKLGLDGPGSSVGNLTLGYTPYWNPQFQRDTRVLVTGERRSRDQPAPSSPATTADINGDYEFALGPGRLKLIGVRHWEHEPLVTTQVLTLRQQRRRSDGTRFGRDTHLGETIGRGEYHWKTRQERLADFARARVQLARPEGRRCSSSIPHGEFVEVAVSRRHRQGHRGPLRRHRHAQPAARPEPRPAGRRGRRDLEARSRRRRPAGAQVLPAEGQRHPRLASGRRTGT